MSIATGTKRGDVTSDRRDMYTLFAGRLREDEIYDVLLERWQSSKLWVRRARAMRLRHVSRCPTSSAGTGYGSAFTGTRWLSVLASASDRFRHDMKPTGPRSNMRVVEAASKMWKNSWSETSLGGISLMCVAVM